MADRESRSPLDHFKSCVLGDNPASIQLSLILRDWFRLKNEFSSNPTNSERAENCKLLLDALRNFQKRRGIEEELENILAALTRDGMQPGATSSDNDEPQHDASASRADDAPGQNEEGGGTKRKRRRAVAAAPSPRSTRGRAKSPHARKHSDAMDSIQEFSSHSDSADEAAESSNFDRECGFCGVTETDVWRRGPMGEATLCNACGVKWAHKRRNPARRSSSPSDSPISDPNSFSDTAIADKDFYWCQYCNLSWPFGYFKNRQQFGAHCSNCSRKRNSRDVDFGATAADGSGGSPHYLKGAPFHSTQNNEVDTETAAESPTPEKKRKISETVQPSSPEHSFGFDADSPPSFGFDHSNTFAEPAVDDPGFGWSSNADERVQGLGVLQGDNNNLSAIGSNINLEVGIGAPVGHLLLEDIENTQEARHEQPIDKDTHNDDSVEQTVHTKLDIGL